MLQITVVHVSDVVNEPPVLIKQHPFENAKVYSRDSKRKFILFENIINHKKRNKLLDNTTTF